MTFQEITALELQAGQKLTLEAGWGYYVGQNFARLTTDTDVEFVQEQGGQMYVKLPASCKFSGGFHAKIQRRAIKAVL
jgi:hypothetical protein